MTAIANETDTLVNEFRQHVGLTTIDAYRSAFCALAVNRGWSSARIGRYLGISRARVGQRIEKLRQYAENRNDMPQLAHLLDTAKTPPSGAGDLPVAFEQADWTDSEFADGMLAHVAGH